MRLPRRVRLALHPRSVTLPNDSHATPPSADTSVGRYRLLRSIARGGMGELHLAEVEGVGGWRKRVALKTVLPHLADDPEFVDRFLDEARIAGRLSHANIVPVFDCGHQDGTYFLAMEYVDGWDVRHLLKTLRARDERLPLPYALRIAREVAEALAYAHALKDDEGRALEIVHRDVTPANILVSRAGDVRLTDFGVAAARGRLSRTSTGQLRGTFYYMSPEQAAGRPLDGRSDIFSVGALLYELVSGVRAFDGDHEVAVLGRVQRGDVRPLAEVAPDLDAGVVALIERALTVDVAERTESARALADALNALLAEREEPAGRADFARWLAATLPNKPAPVRAGPSLDDVLNAQLDQRGRTPTGSQRSGSGAAAATPPAVTVTRSSPAPLAESGLGAAPITATHAPTGGRSSAALLGVLFGAALVAAALAWWPQAQGELDVRSEPNGAQVFVDGVAVGVTDLTLALAPGTYAVRWQLDAYAPEERTVEVSRDARAETHVALAPLDRSVQFFSVPPGAQVQLGDGAPFDAGNAQLVPVGQPVRVRMTLAGYAPLDETLTFDTGASILTRTLTPAPAAEAGVSSAAPAEAARPAPTRPDAARTARATARTWTLRGAGEGAQVYLDGSLDAAATSSGSVRLAPQAGPVSLRVVAADGRIWASTLAPDARGGVLDVRYPAVDELGRVFVAFGPLPAVGDIYVDGIHRGRSTSLREELALPPGEYRIEVRNAEEGRRDEAQVRLVAGEEVTVNVDWR